MTFIEEPIEALSHQLRFLLFEIGIGLSQRSTEAYIKQAQTYCLQNSSSDHLSHAIACHALELAYRDHWQTRLQKETQSYGQVWEGLKATRRPMELMILLEQWAKPHHPSTQEPSFSLREVMQYTPGFNPRIALHAVAIKQKLAKAAGPYQNLIAKYFPEAYEQWEEKLRLQHLDPNEYYLLLMHPWHWQKHILKDNPWLLDHQELICLPHQFLMFPCQSYAQLMSPKPGACSIQFSSKAQQDSALTQKAYQIIREAKHYDDSLYLTKTIGSLELDAFGSLGQIPSVDLQEQANDYLNSDEIAIPLNALLSPSPRANQALLCDIIDSSDASPLDFFKAYCKTLLSGQLQLMSQHRLLIEAEPENTLIVLKQNHIKKIIFRQASIKTAHLEALERQFIQTHLNNNLAQWIHLLNQSYQLNSHVLWAEVEDRLQNIFTHRFTPIDHIKQAPQSMLKPLQRINQT